MSDVFKLLPHFQWRGLVYPVSASQVQFAHESIAHILQYRDNAIVEQTGAQNPTFSYTIPMREDIAVGPYVNLFTVALPVLFRDMRNRDEGPLIDPVYGHFTCVPTSFSGDIDVNRRDGTDVRVEFKLSPTVDEDQQAQAPDLQGVLADAGRLDGDIQRANWHQQVSPEGTTDLLSSINGLLSQGKQNINRVNGALQDVAFRCEKIKDTIDSTPDPKNWPLRASAQKVHADVQALQQSQRRAIVRFSSPLSVVAATNKVTVELLLALNPRLAASPIVAAGTNIRLS